MSMIVNAIRKPEEEGPGRTAEDARGFQYAALSPLIEGAISVAAAGNEEGSCYYCNTVYHLLSAFDAGMNDHPTTSEQGKNEE